MKTGDLEKIIAEENKLRDDRIAKRVKALVAVDEMVEEPKAPSSSSFEPCGDKDVDRFIAMVEQSPGITTTELIRRLGLPGGSQGGAYKKVRKRAFRHGAVETRGTGHLTAWWPTNGREPVIRTRNRAIPNPSVGVPRSVVIERGHKRTTWILKYVKKNPGTTMGEAAEAGIQEKEFDTLPSFKQIFYRMVTRDKVLKVKKRANGMNRYYPK